jgi:sialidase-1
MKASITSVKLMVFLVLISGGDFFPMTAAGQPVEGSLEAFRCEPFFQREVLYEESLNDDSQRVRGPNITIALDGTILAFGAGGLRRSQDGGETWGEPRKVPQECARIVDENTGDILIVGLRHGDRLWRSSDQGKTWKKDSTTLKPNEVMKWLERTGLKKRATAELSDVDAPRYYMHAGASETGITLRHGENKGRLLNTATFRPCTSVHPTGREPVDAVYSCAIYSDNGGKTWQVSGLFPEGYTEEAALAELQDGRIYYNSRSHKGYYDESFYSEPQPDKVPEEERLRRIAWSYDGGETWEDLRISNILPDGGGYDRGYGMMGGLVRLPVKNRDILLYSNADTKGGERKKITIWVSFNGGKIWPLKHLVYEGPK